MNSINRRLERLRAKLADKGKRATTRGTKQPATGHRHFYVESGSVAALLAETDQNGAAKSFAKMMAIGPPFAGSTLSEIMQITDLISGGVWWASLPKYLRQLGALHPLEADSF